MTSKLFSTTLLVAASSLIASSAVVINQPNAFAKRPAHDSCQAKYGQYGAGPCDPNENFQMTSPHVSWCDIFQKFAPSANIDCF